MKLTTMTKSYVFVLKNIDEKEIQVKYGINIILDTKPKNITNIDSLFNNADKKEFTSFLDSSRKIVKCKTSYVNLSNKQQYNCFWDRNPIPTMYTGIGCPIKYVNSVLIKTYYSETTKDDYTIQENITTKNLELIKNNANFKTINKGYYITDGVFCSFNCCMAYIEDVKRDNMYDKSKQLLLKMYNDIHNTQINEIEPAGHWRTLKEYGGDLTIDRFRSSFNKIEYVNHGYTLKNVPLGIYIEEKRRF